MPSFGPIPVALQNAIQQNYLEREFQNPLLNILRYREISDKEEFPGRIGETITKTRVGLMVPNTTPLNPSTNTGLDNGLSPQQYSDEQYVLGIYQYPQVASPINLIDDETTIASFAMRNSYNLGIAQATAVDRIARASLFNAYMGGNSAVNTTNGSAINTMKIDDIRGFQTVVVNGNVIPISASNPMQVFVNGNPYIIQSVAADGTNLSTAAGTGGISGTLTASANFLVADATAGNSVISVFAPALIRPNNRKATGSLISSDLLNMQTIFAAVNILRNNAVPMVRGAYNFYLNSTSMTELYQDPEFQILNRGVSTRDPNYENAWVMDKFLDIRFIMTTETYVQTAGITDNAYTISQTIQRPILCGAGSLVEGIFSRGLDAIRNMNAGGGVIDSVGFQQVINVLSEKFSFEGFYQNIRLPIDQLGQIITQTSNYIGGFTVPTDVTTNVAIIPTANNAYYKRAVIIETA